MASLGYDSHNYLHIGLKVEIFQNNKKKKGVCGLRQGGASTTGLVTFALRHASSLQPRGMIKIKIKTHCRSMQLNVQ